MKKAGVLAASFAVASSVALSFKTDHYAAHASGSNEDSKRKEGGSGTMRGGGSEKFAPRFDGLRFIETLVTAHR